MQETTLEPDGSMGQRKPPRKEKKKLLTAYASILFITTSVKFSVFLVLSDISYRYVTPFLLFFFYLNQSGVKFLVF